MKPSFRQLAHSFLGGRLTELGFAYEHGTYWRELLSGVIQLVMIAHDARTNKTFGVLCGLNARPIAGDVNIANLGIVRGWHVTSKGWDCNSGRWPCDDRSSAEKSLQTITQLIDTLIEPWFALHTRLSDVANQMEEPRGLQRAALYITDGNFMKARSALQALLQWLRTPKPWMTSEELEAVRQDAEFLLQGIGEK
ncbi:MAG: hypothetical protein WCI20_13110 [bacterium]